MPRNNANGVGGMFDDLKSRLGFGRNEAEGEYDDYGEYDDDYGDEAGGEYDDYGPDYDEKAPVGGYRPISTGSSSRSRSSRGDLSSNLVSIDDVRASTRADRAQRDATTSYDGDGYSTSRVGSRNVIDATAPAPSSPAHTMALRELRARSEGLDSLYEPSGSRAYDSYAGMGASSYGSSRSLTVVKPMVYGDVERVARSVRLGDVVVLVMRNTPEDLFKRILDFSFGVASALDANVECPGDKVFAIARGNGLTDDEKARLRSQGAL